MFATYIVFLAIFRETIEATMPVTWTSSPYFVTGTFTYTTQNPSDIINQTIQIQYQNPMTGANKGVNIGIIDFDYHLFDIHFTLIIINTNISPTGFQICVSKNSGSYILSDMKMAYLTVDPSFTQPFSITYFTKWLVDNPIQGPFSLTYYINFTKSTNTTLNLANNNAMLAFQHMINITSPNLCYNIDIIFRIFNQSFYEVTVSSYCNMEMSQFGFSRIIFDKTAIQALGFCYFTYGQLQSTDGNISTLSVIINPIFTNNFMMGMKSFNFSGDPIIKFTTNIDINTSVSSTTSYYYLSFMYWSFKFRNCPNGYPYFLENVGLCYDICPDGMYGNITSYLCLPCHQTCLTCTSNTNTSCLTCNSTNNLLLSNNTCILLSCVDVHCLSCPISVNICLTCEIGLGYQLRNGSCMVICGDGIKAEIQQCDDRNIIDGDGCNGDCTLGNSNSCPKITPYKDPLTQICVLSCPDGFYAYPRLYICMSCLAICVTCTNNTSCLQYSSSSSSQNQDKQAISRLKAAMQIIMPFIYVIIALLIILLVICCCLCYAYRKKKREEQQQTSLPSNTKISQTLHNLNYNSKAIVPQIFLQQIKQVTQNKQSQSSQTKNKKEQIQLGGLQVKKEEIKQIRRLPTDIILKKKFNWSQV